MNSRQFDSRATKGVTGYLMRHGLEPGDLRITALRFGRRTRFEFRHHNEVVHSCFGRDAALEWMKNSEPAQLNIEEAS